VSNGTQHEHGRRQRSDFDLDAAHEPVLERDTRCLVCLEIELDAYEAVSSLTRDTAHPRGEFAELRRGEALEA
jgi:hypothetical protein